MNQLCRTCQEHIDALRDDQFEEFVDQLEKDLFQDGYMGDEDETPSNSSGQTLKSSNFVIAIRTPPASPSPPEQVFKKSSTKSIPCTTSIVQSPLRQSQDTLNTPPCTPPTESLE